MMASALAVLHVRVKVIVGPTVNASQSVQVRLSLPKRVSQPRLSRHKPLTEKVALDCSRCHVSMSCRNPH